jgi:hypothetical protein
MKKILFVLLMVFVVGVAVLFVFMQKLDGIVKTQIEVIGTETLGQTVSVDSVSIELKSGAGEINGLEIRNPDGFIDRNAFQMDKIRLGIDIRSVSTSPLILNELSIEAPVVSLEIREDGGSNLDEIIAHLQAQADASKKPEESKDTKEETEPMYVVIKKLRIVGVQLTARHPKLGSEPRELVLPDITLSNVGGETGIQPSGLGLVIIQSIAEEGVKEALRAEAKNKAGKLLEKASQSLFKRMESSDETE